LIFLFPDAVVAVGKKLEKMGGKQRWDAPGSPELEKLRDSSEPLSGGYYYLCPYNAKQNVVHDSAWEIERTCKALMNAPNRGGWSKQVQGEGYTHIHFYLCNIESNKIDEFLSLPHSAHWDREQKIHQNGYTHHQNGYANHQKRHSSSSTFANGSSVHSNSRGEYTRPVFYEQ
jgi:hypothetical protein